jgi:hypothetical protein
MDRGSAIESSEAVRGQATANNPPWRTPLPNTILPDSSLVDAQFDIRLMATTTTTTSKMLAGHAQLPSEDGRRSARSASSYHSAASYRSADHSGNPYHTYQPAAAHAGEIHLLNMPDDALRVVPGDARAHKLGLSAFQRHPDDRPVTPVGPPPPSPPASVHRVPLVESPEEVNLSTPMSDPLRAPTWLDTTTRSVACL